MDNEHLRWFALRVVRQSTGRCSVVEKKDIDSPREVANVGGDGVVQLSRVVVTEVGIVEDKWRCVVDKKWWRFVVSVEKKLH